MRKAHGQDCTDRGYPLLAGYVAFDDGPRRVNVSFHKSLREIADLTEQGSAPASEDPEKAVCAVWQHVDTSLEGVMKLKDKTQRERATASK